MQRRVHLKASTRKEPMKICQEMLSLLQCRHASPHFISDEWLRYTATTTDTSPQFPLSHIKRDASVPHSVKIVANWIALTTICVFVLPFPHAPTDWSSFSHLPFINPVCGKHDIHSQYKHQQTNKQITSNVSPVCIRTGCARGRFIVENISGLSFPLEQYLVHIFDIIFATNNLK